MKDVKIVLLIVAIVAVVYYGVEPYAQRVMHPQSMTSDYTFADLDAVNTGLTGDVQRGKELVNTNCMSCHSLKLTGNAAPMNANDAAMAWGVVPPDLSLAGRIYATHYLANFIADPVTAMQLSKQYDATSGKTFPMPGYNALGSQAIMDIVAYLQSIGSQPDTNDKKFSRDVFVTACGRCHSMQYAGIESVTPDKVLIKHLGTAAPDLSMYYLSRGQRYLQTFINNPQHLLPGTIMPRVGLTVTAETAVIAYLQSVSDPKKAEREKLAPWVLSYLLVLAILAWLWKHYIWKAVI